MVTFLSQKIHSYLKFVIYGQTVLQKLVPIYAQGTEYLFPTLSPIRVTLILPTLP